MWVSDVPADKGGPEIFSVFERGVWVVEVENTAGDKVQPTEELTVDEAVPEIEVEVWAVDEENTAHVEGVRDFGGESAVEGSGIIFATKEADPLTESPDSVVDDQELISSADIWRSLRTSDTKCHLLTLI